MNSSTAPATTASLPPSVPEPGGLALYLNHDSVAAAPVRARLRLCETSLDEHRALRHRVGALDPAGRACKASAETVHHVFLDCPAFLVPRKIASESLRALDSRVQLDLRILAGIPPDIKLDDAQVIALLRITANLLLAVRARLAL